MSLMKPDVPLSARPTWYRVAYYVTMVAVGVAAVALVVAAVFAGIMLWGPA